MAAGDPIGTDLCSGTTDGNTLPETPEAPEERTIDFGAGIELTSGVTYAIVAKAPNAATWYDGLWLMENVGGYSGGKRKYSRDDGATWSGETKDLWFKTYAGAALRDTYQPTYDGTSSGIGIYNGSYYLSAQTFAATSTYTITKVKVKLQRTSGKTPGTITVSIRATVGAPGAPTLVSPTPTGVTNITLDETPLEWAAGDPVGDTYEIYFREQGDDWELVGEAQAGVEWTIDFGTLAYGTTYEWRIDATNDAGTTTGTTWTFSTISFDQLRISYRLISGGNGNGPYDSTPGVQGTDWEYTGENNMLTVKKLVVAANNKIWHESI